MSDTANTADATDTANTADRPKLFDFDNTFFKVLPELGLPWESVEVPEATILAFNTPLAQSVSVDPERLSGDVGLSVLVGDTLPDGGEPFAMAYAGHQFGSYSPRLGDGRALLLGEVITNAGHRVDLHLKGSGRTPFSRGGDGKATAGPMLREFLIAEAMHALGVPTGRALAVVATGEQIFRQRPEPGAVLTRVASSHLRVGTFEYAARLEDRTVLTRLADYAIERHFPDAVAEAEAEAAGGQGRYVTLLDAVVETQADLITRWMLVGFIHGVMNTDNMTISGETIDYGPCAFMDRYDPATVYSSIDHQGRYAYGNQPAIAQWNLARLAETLLPLMAADAGQEPEDMVSVATEILDSFEPRFQQKFQAGMSAKLGLPSADSNANSNADRAELVATLLELLRTQGIDYTSFFRALGPTLRGDKTPLAEVIGPELVGGFDGSDGFDGWLARWRAAIVETSDGQDLSRTAAAMDRTNPVYIPRNHLVEEALAAANGGDREPFTQLLAVVTDPYTEHPGLERFAKPAPDDFDQTFKTYCGT